METNDMSPRKTCAIILEIIDDLKRKIGPTIPTDDIINEARSQNLDERKVEDALERLWREGQIFRPSRGFISPL